MAYISLYDQGRSQFVSDVTKSRVKEDDVDGQEQLRRFLAARGDPQEAQKSAIALQQDAGKKYGGVKVNDKVVISQKWIDTIVGNINNAIAVGNKLMAGAPETVSAAWFVVKLGLGAIQSDYALYALFGSGLTAMTEMMILIPHYDEMFDRRDKAGYKIDAMTQELFRDIVKCYAAILDFMFSIQRHLEGSRVAKLRHAFKDFFGAEEKKFQGKQDTVMTLKAKVLQSSEAAFKSKVFDSMEDIEGQLKTSINIMESNHREVLESLQELKSSLKPKSRWDFLKQSFEESTKRLEPYRIDRNLISSLNEKRDEGTCSWILEEETYSTWMESTSQNLLCLTGSEGIGKSVLAVAILTHLNKTLSAADYSANYFSCTTKDNDLADLGDDPVAKIRASLLCPFYEILAREEYSESPELLEEANKLFQQPNKSSTESRGIVSGSSEAWSPPLVATIVKLAQLTKKKFILIIDGIDRLQDKDQIDLFKDLSALTDETSCRVLTVCRAGQAFLREARSGCVMLDVDEGSKQDVERVLDRALQYQQALTLPEREEAKSRVMEKASNFAYVTEVAIPFLSQPFQRPLSKRLDQLPEGILDTYKQALRLMQPAYASLLETALTWTLYAQQPVKVSEIMDAHSGIYLAPFERIPNDSFDMYQPSLEQADAELKQIEAASGPYLRTYQGANGVWYCSPKDLVQIRRFCEPVDTLHDTSDHVYCANCSRDVLSSASLVLHAKDVHLRLALTSLRHLNSPLFQRRFALFLENSWFGWEDSDDNEPQPAQVEGAGESAVSLGAADNTVNEREHPEAEALSSPTLNEVDTTGETESIAQDDLQMHEQHDATTNDAEVEEGKTDNGIDESTNQSSADTSSKVNGDVDPSEDVDKDESKDSEDREDNMMREEEPIRDGSVFVRYEVEEWPYHVREAEKLWSAEEREASADWQELYGLLDKFAFDPELVDNWQFVRDVEQRNEETGRFEVNTPLNLAARLGLQSWAEHLIKVKGLSPNEINDGKTPLLCIRPDVDNRELLEFFLKQPGLDPDVLSGSDTWPDPVTHQWLRQDGSMETLQLLIDAGADLARSVSSDKRTALHALAWTVEDAAVLDLALSAPGNPDINAARVANGHTALHFLTMRTDVTVDILKHFLAKGANVNAENDWSMRPLHQACWAANTDIVKAILEHGVDEIDDPDIYGSTALHAACAENALECVQALIRHKADVNNKSDYGRTPLHSAAWDSEKEIIQELIDSNADITVRDGHNRTPFWFACYAKNGPEKARVLLDALKKAGHGIQDINVPSKRQRTPLRFAATHGYSEILQELIDMTKAAGLDVAGMLNMQDTLKGNTALHRAALRGEAECVKILLDAGAKASITNQADQTPMDLAQEQWQAVGTDSYEEIVILLAPATIERVKSDYDLPAIAATNGSVKVLEKLASLGINLNNTDTFGWTPLLLAQRLGLTDVEKFLRSHAAWKANLPSRWIKHANAADALNLEADGTTLTYDKWERFCITTDRPLPGNLDRYYYEITLSLPGAGGNYDRDDFGSTPEVAIGFSNLGGVAYHFPGWEARKGVRNGKSWAYHGDDGWFGSSEDNSSVVKGEQFGPGDVIGAGIDLTTQTIWFTKNGEKLEFEHKNINGRLFPILGLAEGVHLSTNFGNAKMKWKEWNIETGGSSDSDEVDDLTNGVAAVQLGAANGV